LTIKSTGQNYLSGVTSFLAGLLMVEEKGTEGLSKKEMYALLLKEYEECLDEGRECYLEEILRELRKDLELE